MLCYFCLALCVTDGDTNSLSKQDGDDTSVGSSEEQPWMVRGSFLQGKFLE